MARPAEGGRGGARVARLRFAHKQNAQSHPYSPRNRLVKKEAALPQGRRNRLVKKPAGLPAPCRFLSQKSEFRHFANTKFK